MRKDKDEPKIPPLPPLGMPLNLMGPAVMDPLGSYTGRLLDPEDEPVQDADDL